MDAALGCFADSLANYTEFSLEGEVVGKSLPSGDEELPNDRLRGLRRQSKRGVICRHRAPAPALIGLLPRTISSNDFSHPRGFPLLLAGRPSQQRIDQAEQFDLKLRAFR